MCPVMMHIQIIELSQIIIIMSNVYIDTNTIFQ